MVKRSDSPPRHWSRRLTQVIFGLAVAGLVVAGVVAVGNLARDSLGPHDRYLLPFAEIECPIPPGQDRGVFLGEVQYNGRFPDRINVLDPTLTDRLKAAFAAHPRVEKVGKITVGPGRLVEVELTFRS